MLEVKLLEFSRAIKLIFTVNIYFKPHTGVLPVIVNLICSIYTFFPGASSSTHCVEFVVSDRNVDESARCIKCDTGYYLNAHSICTGELYPVFTLLFKLFKNNNTLLCC